MNSKSSISGKLNLKFLWLFASDNLGGINLGGNQEKKNTIDFHGQSKNKIECGLNFRFYIILNLENKIT